MLEWHLWDEFNFHADMARCHGLTLVMFGSPDCGGCRQLRQWLPPQLTGVVDTLVYIDVQVATALAREYEVFHLPQLILFVDGNYHAPISAPPQQLATAICAARQRRPLEAP